MTTDTGSESLASRASRSRSTISGAALLIVPLLGSILCLVITRRGPVIGQDAAAYMGAANNLLHGRGLTTPFDLSGSSLSPTRVLAFHGAVPLVHFPPGYSLTLAALSAFGGSMASVARWLNAALLGGILFVFELLVARFSKSALVVPITAALLLLAGPAVFFHEDLLFISAGVASEPLFLLVFLLGVLFVVQYLERPTRGLFVGIVACSAATPLIRYVGLSFAAAAAAAILVWSPTGRRRGGAATFVFLSGVVPTGIWSYVSTDVLHGESVRSFAVHLQPDLAQGLLSIGSGWFFPASLAYRPRWALFVLLLAFVTFALIRLRMRSTEESAREFRRAATLVVFAASYLAVVIITREFLDATTPEDNRILLPMIPLFYLLVIAALVSVLGRFVWAPLLVGGLCLLTAAPSVGPALALVNRIPRLTTANPAITPTMKAIGRLPPGTLIASGVPDLVYTDTGRSSIRVPVRVEGTTERANHYFTPQVRQLSDALARRHGVLVAIPAAWTDSVAAGATPADFEAFADLHVLRTLPGDSIIYGVTPPTSRE